ncbi:unnamed protein product [Adineta steineri]|uniref:ADP-ribosylglycohydrolase n=1 Tax=Adineta steineri TaxID=433720 RepID=A0A814EZH0_9BILA|nr:unnamed protein product [Adineta steineri]CAF4074456.1 unnamed protein product [Adineta steineri]
MLKFPSPYQKVLPHDIPVIYPQDYTKNTTIGNRIVGSIVGLAVGDALGASVEFRSHQYLSAYPIFGMMSGGTWGLEAGQWTDDTSMALCLAASLITEKGYDAYDQMVRYKWWYKYGYLSSTGHCFDIGNGTRDALDEFYNRQHQLKKKLNLQHDLDVDQLPRHIIREMRFNVNCSKPETLGNGALMRLAPVPLFFYRKPSLAVELSGQSACLTHGDDIAIDACRYYGALIVAAIIGESKENILSEQFYHTHRTWFGIKPLHSDIIYIANGSFKQPGGYKDGIRGKGHVVMSLEAALWAFWKGKSFRDGVLNAVNLGDDTDTTAAIYGQLAGAYYTYQKIPQNWINQLYANSLIICIGQWLQVSGYRETQKPKHKKAQRVKSLPPNLLKQHTHVNKILSGGIQHLPTEKKHKKRHRSKHVKSPPVIDLAEILLKNELF